MALSEWPEHFRRDEARNDYVMITFEPELFVAIVTKKAIGLKQEDDSDEVDIWLPVSQIAGKPPAQGEWIDSIEIPRWLAIEKEFLDEDGE